LPELLDSRSGGAALIMTIKRTLSLLLVAVLTAASLGCQQCNLRGDGFREPFSDMGNMRPKAKAGGSFGFSTKARQIEEDMGF
jgi:hypothetical protein